MTQAKLTVTHDYLSVRTKFADKTTLNLTVSRSGEKASGATRH